MKAEYYSCGSKSRFRRAVSPLRHVLRSLHGLVVLLLDMVDWLAPPNRITVNLSCIGFDGILTTITMDLRGRR